MEDVERLLAAFASGELDRPAAERPNLVDLSRAMATVGGADGPDATAGSEEIAGLIGNPEHLVFVLADGLGMALLRALPPGAFLRRHLASELLTPFPSTTAVGLTTLATGEWPARHGIVGWWTYLREIDGAATVVRFERRADGKPLDALGVEPAQLLPLPSLLPRMSRDVASFFPSAIVGSAYSCYVAGGTAQSGYGSLAAAVDAVLRRLEHASSPTYTYLYTPRVDAAAHEYGTKSHHLSAELIALDRQIERLVEGAAPGARVVVSADHGHLDAPAAKRHLLSGEGALAETLRVAPSGDPRVMYFHLRDGAEGQFREAIERRLGEIVFVLSTDELEELELLGPGPLSPLTRERLGDFVAIAGGADAVGFSAVTGGRKMVENASQHSGLTPEQMRVPLVIA